MTSKPSAGALKAAHDVMQIAFPAVDIDRRLKSPMIPMMAEAIEDRTHCGELADALQAFVKHGCECYAVGNSDWHSERCPMPQAEAVLKKVGR